MKSVIYLRIIGDLSFKEIGDILGKTENWARITFYRGKEKLKEEKEYEEKNSCVSLMYGNGSLPATDAGYTGG